MLLLLLLLLMDGMMANWMDKSINKQKQRDRELSYEGKRLIPFLFLFILCSNLESSLGCHHIETRLLTVSFGRRPVLNFGDIFYVNESKEKRWDTNESDITIIIIVIILAIKGRIMLLKRFP